MWTHEDVLAVMLADNNRQTKTMHAHRSYRLNYLSILADLPLHTKLHTTMSTIDLSFLYLRLFRIIPSYFWQSNRYKAFYINSRLSHASCGYCWSFTAAVESIALLSTMRFWYTDFNHATGCVRWHDLNQLIAKVNIMVVYFELGITSESSIHFELTNNKIVKPPPFEFICVANSRFVIVS